MRTIKFNELKQLSCHMEQEYFERYDEELMPELKSLSEKILRNPMAKAVQFFGTGEIGILSSKTIVSNWAEGVEKELYKKSKKNNLPQAYCLAKQYIETEQVPAGWWSAPIEEEVEEEVVTEPRIDKEVEKKKKKSGKENVPGSTKAHPWTKFSLSRLEIRHATWFHTWHGA